MRASRATVPLFLLTTFLYWVSLYLFVPTLPSYVESVTTNFAMVGVVLSMYGLWQAIIRIPMGVGVDATGRGKPFIILGLLCCITGTVLMGTASTASAIAVGRAFTGLAAGTWVPLVAVFSGLFPAKRAVFASSLLTFAGSAGRMLSTALNGVLNNAGGYPVAFFLAAGAAGLAIILVLLTRVERRAVTRPSLRAILGLFRRRDFILPTLLSTVVMFGTWAVTFSFLPIRAADLGANDVLKSLLIATNIAAVTAGNLANTVVSTRIRHIVVVVAGLAGLCGGMALAALAPGVGVLFVAMAIMGLANGFNYPTLMGMSIGGVDAARRTIATGIHQSVYAIGMFTGPWIAGVIADVVGIPWAFGITAGACLVAGSALVGVLAGGSGTKKAALPSR